MLNALFPKIKRKVLVLFYSHPDRSYHLREVVRHVNGGMGAVERELKVLTSAGMLNRRKHGSNIIYQVNRDNPIFSEIHNLIVKTAGIADVIRSVLLDLKGITYAFIFGSTSIGEIDQISDIDVFVIGDTTFTKVSSALFSAQKTLDRDVSPVVYSIEEYTQKVSEENHFINNVLGKNIIMLIGSEDDLRAMG